MGGLGGISHWLVLGGVAILLLGGGRFSALMGDVAKGVKQFKKGLSEEDEDGKPASRIDAKAEPEPAAKDG